MQESIKSESAQPGLGNERDHACSTPVRGNLAGLADELGWSALYDASPAFKLRFDEMCEAVETLPPPLIRRARALGYPQLHVACVRGEVAIVSALLTAGLAADAYPYTEDDSDEPPLVWLANEDDLALETKIQIATLLLAHGADIDEGDALNAALDADDEGFADFLREAGASP